jgi:hypothetical protein
MTNVAARITIQAGMDAGKSFDIPSEGVRIGRSSKNDIVLGDPLLSRYHCRLFMQDGGLWVTDLGSANQTLLNDEPVTEAALHTGNLVMIGDTVIRVDDDGRQAGTDSAAAVDLGFGAGTGTRLPGRRRLRPLPIAVAALVLIAAAWLLRPSPTAKKPSARPGNPTLAAIPEPQALTVIYEKIEASPANIFRYALNIEPDRTLSIAVDDVTSNRSLARDKKVGQEVIDGLTEFIRESGFARLEALYRGVTPGQVTEQTLTVIIGRDAHTVRVSNTSTAPDVFNRVCSKLENVGKVELGLWAIQYSTEQLVAMAEEAMLQGRKLSTEREVAPGNLAAAISSLNEAEWLLEAVEVKPPFFQTVLDTRREAIEALAKRYEEINFKAERAVRLRDWETAAAELRMVLDIIPDREDARHLSARKQLIEVEARRNPAR